MTLTGRTRYRRGWRGRLILQLEFSYGYLPAGCRPSGNSIATRHDWRDATVADYFDGRVPPAPIAAPAAANLA